MRLRKMAAGIVAAAMAFASLPHVVSASSSEPEFGVGDTFYVNFDPETGTPNSEPFTDWGWAGSITGEAGYGCTILSSNTIGVSTSCMVNSYAHRGKKITIPEKIAGYTVTQIGYEAHRDDGSTYNSRCIGGFASITIPDTVTTIYQGAFSENILLEEIKFGANSQLKLIDQNAFSRLSFFKVDHNSCKC